MRILVVCRLMSGFEESVLTGTWNPSGAPAISRLIDRLDRGDDTLELIMTRQGAPAPLQEKLRTIDGEMVALAGLRAPIRVLFSGTGFFGRGMVYWRDVLHTCKIWRQVCRIKPEIIYVDRSNVFTGAVLARVTRVPVVLRMLGVPPDLWAIIDGRRPAERLLRWAYRAPFAQVIGSMDGSGSEAWLGKMLDPSVPRRILLNGVDHADSGPPPAWLNAVSASKIVVAFLGRIEKLKGADFFIEAIFALPPESLDKIHALVVGDGALLESLKQRVAAAGAEGRITFTGALSHAEVSQVLAASHIYVSLNRQGHVSNASLEAMAARLCFVIQRNRADGADPEFDNLLGPDSYVALASDDTPARLAEVLTLLADDLARRAQLVATLEKDLQGKLQSWDERIEREIDLLREIAGRAA